MADAKRDWKRRNLEDYLASIANKGINEQTDDTESAVLELSEMIEDCNNAILELSEIIGG